MANFKTPAIRRFTLTVAAAATALALMTIAAVPARAGQNRDDFAKAMAALEKITVNPLGEGYVVETRFPQRRMSAHREPGRITLPQQCAVQLRGYRQSEVVYPQNCLRQAGITSRLPQHCEVNLAGRGESRIAFEQNCLLHEGFKEQGRRSFNR